MIPKSKVWQFLLLFIGAVALWFTGDAIIRLYGYISQNAEGVATITQWNVKEFPGDRYVLSASYSFHYDGKQYQGETVFEKPRFLNRWAAEEAIRNETQQTRPVWFSSWNPDHSTLQKSFPIKECLSAVLLWGLVIYFIGLNEYVSKRR